MSSTVTAAMVLDALAEDIRPRPVHDRYDQGTAWASANVRRILDQHRLWGTPDDNLAAVEPAIRAWLADGPDYDTEDYTRGCETAQEHIRQILDRDPGAIEESLDDAVSRQLRALRAINPDWKGHP